MNEKQLREAIIQRIEIANAEKLSTIWHFVRTFVEPTGEEEIKRK